MTHKFLQRYACAAFLSACGASLVMAQSNDDRQMLERARLAYLTRPVPSSITCGVEVNWDRFYQEMKIEMDDATKAREEKLKTIKVAMISKSAAETEVKVDAPDELSSMGEGIRQQLNGFFQMYWSMNYGRVLTKTPADTFKLMKTPDGYTVKGMQGLQRVEVDVDRANIVTGARFLSPQMNVFLAPGFRPGADGLLRLRTLVESTDFGSSKIVIGMSIDYQTVGAFEVPQHIRMATPGSFSFNYTFVGCEVKGTAEDRSLTKN